MKDNHMTARGRKNINTAPSLEEFETLATRIIDEIPEKLCSRLNGGFILLPDEKSDGSFFIMGEYVEEDIMGCSIIIYYGSFVKLLGESGLEVWEEEIRDTVLHELRHHLESLAGVNDLVVEDLNEIENYLRQGKYV